MADTVDGNQQGSLQPPPPPPLAAPALAAAAAPPAAPAALEFTADSPLVRYITTSQKKVYVIKRRKSRVK
jgi:hypothetical protein